MKDGREWLLGKYGPPNPAPVEDVARDDPSYLRWVLENVEDIITKIEM